MASRSYGWLAVVEDARTLRASAADRALQAQATRRLELRLAVGIAVVVGVALSVMMAVRW